jgi:MFS family permease
MEHGSQHESKWQVRFFTLWIGQAISLLGSMLVGFALVWWLTESTGSATVLATATLVCILPGILVGPFAGALVDRWNRRAVMIVADSIVALATVALAYLFFSGAVRTWHVYAIMFIRATAGGFHWPAMQASTSLMVPEKHLARVAGLNQTLHGAMNIVSPPLGALLLDGLPIQGILAIDVVTAAVAITILFFVHIPQPQSRPAAAGAAGRKFSLWADVRAGLRYVWGWPGLLAVLVMATVINFLFNPAFSLMPLLVTKHFGGQAIHLGWLQSAWGIGVVLGGLTLGVWDGRGRDGRRHAARWDGTSGGLLAGVGRPVLCGLHEPDRQRAAVRHDPGQSGPPDAGARVHGDAERRVGHVASEHDSRRAGGGPAWRARVVRGGRRGLHADGPGGLLRAGDRGFGGQRARGRPGRNASSSGHCARSRRSGVMERG